MTKKEQTVTSGNTLFITSAQVIQPKQENMSLGSIRRFERKKMKGLKVLELFDQGFSYRKIAKLLHMYLRDISKFINLAADKKTKPPSTVSIHDLIILEFVSTIFTCIILVE